MTCIRKGDHFILIAISDFIKKLLRVRTWDDVVWYAVEDIDWACDVCDPLISAQVVLEDPADDKFWDKRFCVACGFDHVVEWRF